MSAFLISTAVVAVAEFGDKTQLLAIVLAARFRRPLAVVAGIVAATLLNHAAAGLAGSLVVRLLDPAVLRWVLGLSFLAVAAWALIPDRLDDDDKAADTRAWGAFAATAIAFFLVEIGDKTQIATVALAARFDDIVPVVLGTTCGMIVADAPAVWLGDRAATRLPLKALRMVAAAIFAVLGALVLLGVGMD